MAGRPGRQTEHNELAVQQCLEGPYCVIVWLLLHQLWCHVQWRAFDRCEHHGVGGHGTSKAKVAQLDNAIGPNQDVLWLHVSVNDAICVQIVQGTHKLLGNTLHCCFWEALIIFQNLKQLPCAMQEGVAFCMLLPEYSDTDQVARAWLMRRNEVGRTMAKLCDHTKVGFGLECVQHLNNILMPQVAQNLYLLSQIPDVFLAFAMLHDELHGGDLPSELSAPFVHLMNISQAALHMPDSLSGARRQL